MKTSTKHTLDEYFLAFIGHLQELEELVREDEKGLLKQPSDLVVCFEETHEAALACMSRYYLAQGRGLFSGSRDLTVEAFHDDLIDDGQGWLDMVISRIKATDIYPEDVQEELRGKIRKKYLKLLQNFERKMKNLLD